MQPDTAAPLPNDLHDQRLKQVWSELKSRIQQKDFELYFHQRIALRIVGEQLIVALGSKFLLSWIQKRFRPHIAAAGKCILGDGAEIRFLVDGNVESETVAPSSKQTLPQVQSTPANDGQSTSQPSPIQASLPRQTQRRFARLSDFVVGGEDDRNRLPYLAGLQVCKDPGVRHNPLFLYGNTGCGKTHLLEGIYSEVRRRHPSLRVQLLTAENFTNHFTSSMRKNTGPQFRQRFRTVDVLLVDNVEFFEGKVKTQWEFLRTLEELVQHGRHVVLTCDRHPRLLTDICEELTSRFAAGLICRVEAPALGTRIEIVRRLADRLKVRIKPDATRIVARRFSKNIRLLAGAVNAIANHYEILRKPINASAAREALADYQLENKRVVTAEEIEQAVCEFFRVSSAALRSKQRSRGIVVPRMIAMYLIRKYTQRTYTDIGIQFGGRNHATVISAEKRVRACLQTNEPVPIASQQSTWQEIVSEIESRWVG